VVHNAALVGSWRTCGAYKGWRATGCSPVDRI